MSHFTTVETKIKNFVILQRVIEKLGYKLKLNETHIRGYRNELTEVDFVIDTKSSIDIGIKKVGETYSFVSDWENLETHAGIEQKDFLKQITKAYAYENVMAEIKKKGYVVADEKTDQQQHVHITVRKWG
ncbi:MAG TPA: DUF1257 domain-containing protein [Planctomycetota bacterium]|nr:DUF1257 domain-containing protein [Planctomycetota bacterium]